MRFRLAAIATTLVVTSSVVSACSGTANITSDAGELDGTAVKAALTQAEQNWRQLLDADGPFKVHDKAHCYLATSGGKYTGKVYCGPARRAGAGEGLVWTTFDVAATSAGNGKATVGKAEKATYSQSLPGDVKLWRPDDVGVPGDANKLDAPPLPAAQAGSVAVVEDIPIDGKAVELADARLVSTDFSVTVTGVAQISSVPGSALGDTGAKLLGPATGERFLLVRVSTKPLPTREEPGFQRPGADLDGTTETFIAVGDKRTPIKLNRLADQNVLVSVPASGGKVLLGTRAGGKEQTLDLSSGARTSPHPGQYRSPDTVKADHTLPTAALASGQFKANYTMTVPMVSVTSWDEQFGWAPDGKMWVRVPYQSLLTLPLLYKVALKPGSISATADGKALQDRTPDAYWRPQNAGLALFLTDGNTKTVHIKMAPVITFTGSASMSPPSGSLPAGVMEFDATFG